MQTWPPCFIWGIHGQLVLYGYISIYLIKQTYNAVEISYALGGWLAPIGIEYRVDTLNSYVLFIVSGRSSIVMLFARKSVEFEISTDKHYLFYSCYLLMLTGLLGMAITGDAFNVFVFIEISS